MRFTTIQVANRNVRMTLIRTILVAAFIPSSMPHFSAQAANCEDAAKNHGESIKCEAEEADQQRVVMLASLDRTLAAASAFHSRGNPDLIPAIVAAQQAWATWMQQQCTLEGLVEMGASAPEPGMYICEQRLIKSRQRELDDLGRTLGSGQ